MSDVYSFGVVLLELLTGRKSVDKSRPHREQNLVDWARPMLNDSRKLCRIMDPRLEGQYSESGVRKAAALAYQCLSHRPKQRPTMSTVVKTLEPLQNYNEFPIGTFVYMVPTESNQQKDGEEEKEQEPRKERRRSHRNHRRSTTPRSPNLNSDNGLRRSPRNGMKSPLHHSSGAA